MPLLVSVLIMYIKIVLHCDCVVPNNIYTCTKEVIGKFKGEERSLED